MSRRARHRGGRFVGNASVFALAALIGLAAAMAPRGSRADVRGFYVQMIADGDYGHFGLVATTDPANAGDIANIGIVIGRDAVAVIDTGGSVAVGDALLEAVRRLTDLPIRYVINTHEHPDHVFGNAAFAATGATFVGHRRLPGSLRAHGPFYLQSFRDLLGAEEIARVRLIPPTRLVDDTTELDLGDRKLLLTAWSQAAHTDCDLTVLDEKTHVLFSGDLVFLQHTPVVDGSVRGWLELLPKLAAIPATLVLPGHGRVVAPWPQALDDERRYLLAIQADARRLIAVGVPLADAVRSIGGSEQTRWQLFDDYNRRNATAVYSELEWE